MTFSNYLQIDGSLFIMLIVLMLNSKYSMLNLITLTHKCKMNIKILFKIQCRWFLNNYQFFQEKMNLLGLGKVNSKVGILLMETNIIKQMDLIHYIMLQQNLHPYTPRTLRTSYTCLILRHPGTLRTSYTCLILRSTPVTYAIGRLCYCLYRMQLLRNILLILQNRR